MRYVKWILIAIIAAWLVGGLVMNVPELSREVELKIGWLPFQPQGVLVMKIWAALVAAFTLAFITAVVLEVAAWYEYTRIIRLQRRQIRSLQEALDQCREPTGPSDIPS